MGLKVTLKRYSREFKKKVVKNDRIYILLRCIKSLNDPNLSKLLKGFYEGGSTQYAFILVNRIGTKHPEANVVYHITQGKAKDDNHTTRSEVGFCAILRNTLVYLYFADYFKFTPVVEWGQELTYYDSEMDSVTKNVFEYYFKPVSQIPYEDVVDCTMVVEQTIGHWNFFLKRADGQSAYETIESEIDKLAYIYRKYIHLNERTRQYLEDNINNICGGFEHILAVHYRGTDFNVGFRDHPVAVGIDECLSRTKKIFDGGEYDKIFLATDDSDALESFIRAFGDKLIYYPDAMRTSGHCGTHNTFCDRPLHYYKLGLEVLLDIYTLANCDSLICGLSQVSFAARYVNQALGRNFKELEIIDNGVNRVSSKEGNKILHKNGLS